MGIQVIAEKNDDTSQSEDMRDEMRGAEVFKSCLFSKLSHLRYNNYIYWYLLLSYLLDENVMKMW